MLRTVVFCYRTADQVATASLSVQIRREIRNRILLPGGHDLLMDHQTRMIFEHGLRFTQSIIDSLDLGRLHFHGRSLGKIYLRGRIHETLSAALALSVMLLNIANLGILPYMEGVDTVMGAVSGAAIMDAAACYDDHIAVLPDKEIIIYAFLKSGLG